MYVSLQSPSNQSLIGKLLAVGCSGSVKVIGGHGPKKLLT